MANQPCPDIAQFIVKMQAEGQDIQNAIYFKNTGTWEISSLTDVADAILATWTTQMMPKYCPDVQLLEVVGTDLSSLNTSRVVSRPAAPVVGTHGGVSAPANACIAITESIGSRGRGKQGRLFIGPLPEEELAQSDIDPTFATDICTAIIAVAAAAVAATADPLLWVVLSRVLNGVPRAGGIGLEILTAFCSNFITDSQRTRLPGHKKHRAPAP